ncbi:MAG: PQQ-dependent sugar dehydrogenase [Opitutales bacterium]
MKRPRVCTGALLRLLNCQLFNSFLLILGSVLAVLGLSAPQAAALPTDFTKQTVVSGLSQPITLRTLPDGRMLVGQKGGEIRVFDPSGSVPVASSLFMEINNINSGNERGLLDLTLDPDYTTNGYFYVYYTPSSPQQARISRFTDTGSPASRLASEVVIWQDLNGYTSCCHYGGGLDFGPDGKLYLTTADQFNPRNRRDASPTTPISQLWSQDLTNPGGKVLRMNKDGSVPDGTDGSPANPFADGPGGNYDYIWDIGLRNPFRARWDLQYGVFYIGEVGGNTQSEAQEDVHITKAEATFAGLNFGWPFCEGSNCFDNPIPLNFAGPIFTYAHTASTPNGGSITGGVVSRGRQYPNLYEGAYFYGDYSRQFVNFLLLDSDGTTVLSDNEFDTDAGLVVAFENGPDGAIYTANLAAGSVSRYVFDNGNLTPDIDSINVGTPSGSAPQAITFNATVSDNEGDPMTYEWVFGDGNSASGTVPGNGILPQAQHTYTSNGVFTAFLTVSDAGHTTFSESFEIQVGNVPTASIAAPANGSLFRAGQTINYTAAAPPPGATYEWLVERICDGVAQTVQGPVGGSNGSFSIPTDGAVLLDNNCVYRITLTVTNADLLTDTAVVTLNPDTRQLTLASTPNGICLLVEGEEVIAPATLNLVIGQDVEIAAPSSECIVNTFYSFDSWSNSQPQSQTLTVPTVNTLLTANFLDTGTCSVPVTNGLVLALDGGIGLGFSSGTSVNLWEDQTTSGNDLSVVSGAPQVVAGGLNGRDYVAFDGTDDSLGRTGFSGLPIGAADRTVFQVVRYDSNGFGGFAWGINNVNETFGLIVTSGGDLAIQGWGGANDQNSGVAGTGEGWLIQSVVVGSDTYMHYRDGNLIDNGTHTWNTAATQIRLGSEIDDTPNLDMDVAEILVYDRALTEQERQDVESYLFGKYFLSGPSITITSPTQGADITGDAITVNVTSAGPDNAGDQILFSLDGGASVAVPLTGGTASFTFSGLSGGNHTVLAQAANNAGEVYGNPTAVDSVSVTTSGGAVFTGILGVTNGLVLQLESDLKVTVSSDNTTVVKWLDQSGLGNNLAVVNGGPLLLNGLTPTSQPALRFDGDDSLENEFPLSGFPSGSGDRSMFMIVKYDSATAFAGAAYGTGSDNQAFGLVVNGGGGNLAVQGWGSSNDIVSSVPGSGEGWLMHEVVVNAGSVAHFKDGIPIDTFSRTYNTALTKLVIGEEISGLGFVDMDIAAILLYDRAVTAVEREQIQTFLQNKYLTGAPPNIAPNVAILSPATGTTVTTAQAVNLTGTASDTEDGDLTPSIQWSSSIDGALGNGATVNTTLSEGTHTITAMVTDSGLTPAMDTITVEVTAAGSAVAIPVTSGLVLQLESDLNVVNVTGDATVGGWLDQSGNGNDLSASGDPQLVPASTPTGLPAVVFDGAGDFMERTTLTLFPTGADDRTMFFLVKYNDANAFAGAAFGTGAPNQAFGLVVNAGGDDLTVQGWGSGNDIVSSELGNGAGWLLQWVVVENDAVSHYKDTTLIDSDTQTFNTVLGRFALGQEISGGGFADMEVAAVALYNRALDSTEQTQVRDYLLNKFINGFPSNDDPSVDITAPSNGSGFLTTASVNFTGTASDTEDGDLASSIQWTSSIDGPLGSGASISVSLSEGTHDITATVTDSGFASDADTLTVVINAPTPVGGSLPVTNGLVLQLESDLGLSLSGNEVVGWADQSGAGNDVAPVEGTPEFTTDATPSGLPAIVLTSDSLENVSALSGFPDGSEDRTLFFVTQYNSANAFGGVSYGNGAPGETFGLVVNSSGGNLTVQGFAGGISGDLISPVEGTGEGWLIQSAIVDNTQVTHFKEDVTIDSATRIYDTVLNKLVLGEEIAGNGFANVDVAAVLLFNRALSPAEHAQVVAFLQGKYFTGTVTVNTDPSVDITAPSNGSGFLTTDTVSFTGTADDAEDGDLSGSIQWASNLDGPLGSGTSISVFLSEGTHDITASVTDTGNASDTDTITVNVSTPPPVGGGVPPVTSGLVVQLESDIGLSDASGTITMWSDQSGQGNDVGPTDGAAQLLVSGTPTGLPAVAFDGDDNLENLNGLSNLPDGSDDRTMFFVVKYDAADAFAGAAYGNGAQNQAFGLVVNGSSGFLTVQGFFSQPDKISTTPGIGEGWLVQSAVVDNTQLTHYKDDAAIDAATRTYNTNPQKLVLGEEISNGGYADMDAAALLIYNRALSPSEIAQVQAYLLGKYITGSVATPNTDPTVDITAPASGSSFLTTDTVSFVASADDAEDGDISNDVVWSSSLDGNLGSGASINVSMSEGTHTVTAIITDSQGANDDATVTVTINAVPPVGGTLPISTGLVLQLESDLGVNLSGDAVVGWADQSGTGNDVAPVEGSPEFSTDATPGGLPAIVLTSDSLENVSTLSGFPDGSNDRTLFFVTRYNSANAFGGAAYGNGAPGEAFGLVVNATGGNLTVQGFAGGLSGDAISPVEGTGEGWLIQSVIVDDTQVTHFKDDITIDSVTRVYETVPSKFVLGEEIAGNGFANIEVAAVLLFDRALSPAEHLQVVAFLQDKYFAGTVAPNTDPTVDITTPANGSSFLTTDTISFVASASDAEDGDISNDVSWTSSLDGALGSGATIAVSLSEGTHDITALVSDSQGASDDATVTVTVNAPLVSSQDPTVSITAPADASAFFTTDLINFTATANDFEDGDLSGSVMWASNLDGTLGVGASINVALSEGSHDITATVIDSDTRTANDNIGVQVSVDGTGETSLPVRGGLVVQLESDIGLNSVTGDVTLWEDQSGQNNDVAPVDGMAQALAARTPSLLPAVVFDGDDNLENVGPLMNLPDGSDDRTMFLVANYRSADAFAGAAFGTGSTNQAFGLVVNAGGGNLAVQGFGGSRDTVSSTPGAGAGWLVQSATVASGAVTLFKDGTSIATDTQFYNTGSTKLVLAEEISNGGFADMDIAAVLIYDRALNEGERLAVEAYLQAKYLQAVAVNLDPSVDITAPADGANFFANESITFLATAVDAEDGDISDDIAWASNLDGPLGNGTTVTVMLSSGTHAITASVQDSDGATSDATITVNVASPLTPMIALFAGASTGDETISSGPSDDVTFTPTLLSNPVVRNLTIQNQGQAPLNIFSILAPAGIDVSNAPAAPVQPGATATFTLVLSADMTGEITGTVTINSDDPIQSVFTFPVNAVVVALGEDTDNDGMDDWPELQLAALGFDYLNPQPDLVDLYFATASLNDLFTVEQLQGIAFEAPVLTYNPQTGRFTLTLRLKKTTDLNAGPNGFQNFDFNLPDIRVNADGELEFDFESAEDAAFFILEAF